MPARIALVRWRERDEPHPLRVSFRGTHQSRKLCSTVTGLHSERIHVSVQYHFRQTLRAPARLAYDWCTDFGPDDGKLFFERTDRTVRWIGTDALVMTDTTYSNGRPLCIRRLVRLNPSKLAWTNTHLDGPYRFSQFWYRIVSDGPRRCRIEFHGLRLVTSPTAISAIETARRADVARKRDAGEWRRRLAPALERDLGGGLGAARRVERYSRSQRSGR